MPNVNKIKLEGEHYDIEDTQARNDAYQAMIAASEAIDLVNNIIDPPDPPDPPPVGANFYGVRWYKTTSLTTLERIQDAAGMTFSPSVGAAAGRSDFDDVYPWSGIKLCLVVNGAPAYYQGDPGFTLTPAAGDIMAEIPAYYYQVVESALHRDYVICDLDPSTNPAPDGFVLSPRHMATPGNPAGWDKIYASAYTLNSSYRSISGNASIVSIDRPTARAGCRNRGTQYQLYDYATYCTIWMLYLVEVANWDSQIAIGPGYTDAANTAQINTGGADSVAWHSGRASGNAIAARNAVKYRGMENLWGNIWTWCDGINFNDSTIYVNLNPATYADGSAAGNALVYAKATANGFIKSLGFDPTFPFAQICVDATGADGTFVSDYYYQSTAWRALFLGGYWANAGSAGLFYFYSNNLASYVYTRIGARLLVLP